MSLPGPQGVFGGRIQIEEEDGSPTGKPHILKVTNGGLTDNGDDTFSLDLTAGSQRTAVDQASDVTLAAAITEAIFTNIGAGAPVTITAHADHAVDTRITLHRVVDQPFRFDPSAGGAVIFSGGKLADGKYIELAFVGSSAQFTKNSDGDWMAVSEVGGLVEES